MMNHSLVGKVTKIMMFAQVSNQSSASTTSGAPAKAGRRLRPNDYLQNIYTIVMLPSGVNRNFFLVAFQANFNHFVIPNFSSLWELTQGGCPPSILEHFAHLGIACLPCLATTFRVPCCRWCWPLGVQVVVTFAQGDYPLIPSLSPWYNKKRLKDKKVRSVSFMLVVVGGKLLHFFFSSCL